MCTEQLNAMRWFRTLCAALVITILVYATPAHAYVDLIFVDGAEGCPLSFADADSDGFGTEQGVTTRCNPGAHFASVVGDCNDNDANVHPGAPDVPDAAFVDSNCDGIDGDLAHAVFVANGGDDANACTPAAPCATITHALSSDSTHYQVLVQAGAYNEYVQIVAGKSIYGGYDSHWVRGDRNVTQYAVHITNGVHAQNVAGNSNGPTVGGLFIETPSANGAGASSIAALLVGSSGVFFDHVTLVAGNGGDGTSQTTQGSAGDNGGDGIVGHPGCEASPSIGCDLCTQPAVGNGGTSTCGNTGGAGGLPGLGPGSGANGGSGISGTQGGTGGLTLHNGDVGDQGADGAPGNSGAGGSAFGQFVGTAYEPATGFDGGSGANAQGGGGGGGGGGGTNQCDSYGSSGGGGGGSGCGGGNGFGAAGGGGSFAVVLIDSTATISDSLLTTNKGGSGGDGSDGGTGGTGGTGGPGGPYGGIDEQDDAGNGGPGGPGGDAGHGGAGGAGGGGPSVAVVCVGTSSATLTSATFSQGTGGFGGFSSGNPGATGTTAHTHGCS